MPHRKNFFPSSSLGKSSTRLAFSSLLVAAFGCTANLGGQPDSEGASIGDGDSSGVGASATATGASGSVTTGGFGSGGLSSMGTGSAFSTGGVPIGGGTGGGTLTTGGTLGTGSTTSTGGTSSTGGTTSTGGTPGTEPFKGIAGQNPCSDLNLVGATWFYTWGLGTDCNPGADVEFVPMVWSEGAIENIGQAAQSGATTLLGFNEPDRAEQANMSVGEAIGHWPALEATGLRLGSPATDSSPNGEAWLADFMEQANNQGRRVDFIAVHWYGWGSNGCDSIDAHFTGFMERMLSYGLPVWITEWGCFNESEADVRSFYNSAVAWLLARPQVERFSWFLTRASQLGGEWGAQDLVDGGGNLTPLGQDYVATQARR